LPALQHVSEVGARRGNWAFFIEIPTVKSLWDVLPHHVTFAAIVCLFSAYAMWREWRHLEPQVRIPRALSVTLVLGWLAIPMLLTWLLARFDIARLFLPRYLVAILPASGVCMGLLVSMIPGLRQRVAFASVAALLVVSWTLGRTYQTYGSLAVLRGEDWPGAIALLNAHDWQTDEPLLFASGLIEAEALKTQEDNVPLRRYCCYPLYSAYPLNLPPDQVEPLTFDKPGELSERLQRRVSSWLADHDQLLLLVRGTEGQAKLVAKDIVASTAGVKAGKFHDFGIVWVIELEARR
jgi:hypothetical protein